MSTKITTPELFNLSSNNTEATQLPVFTTSTRPTPTASTLTVDYLVVAGGGGGGANRGAGGGGAGGYRTSFGAGNISGGLQPVESSLTLATSTAYTLTVGLGGAPGSISTPSSGSSGTNSIFDQITSTGGGGGRGGYANQTSLNGGSGGGGSNWAGNFSAGGTAVTPIQGFAGGNGNSLGASSNQEGGLGGGGAGSIGASVTTLGTGGDGGSGLTSSITGTPLSYAGGGGGSSNLSSGSAGTGSDGGGDGRGKSQGSGDAQSGTPNTGGGGGSHPGQTISGNPGSGGSGIVILRYPTNSSPFIKTTGSLVYTESTNGSDTVLQFTEGSGNVSFVSTGIAVGEMIFNSTTEKVEYWDGFQWNMIKDEAVAAPIEPNQILWLDADNTNSWTGSGSTWFDVSGNGYDATITTPVPSTGTVNGATYLNIPSSSRADYFKIPYSIHSGALNMTSGNVTTWLYWMRLPNIPTGVNGLSVLLKASPIGLTTNQVYLNYYDPSIEGFNFFVYDYNGTKDIDSRYIAQVNNNDWFMFVAIFNYPANNFQFHRYQPNTTTYNNTALGNVSPKTTVNSDIYLISEPAGSYGGYGELGEIRAYNTTFTTAEITAKYNAQKGKYGIT